MDILDLIKKSVKKIGIYQFLERWIVSSQVGAGVYISFMQTRAASKGIRLVLEKTGKSLKVLISRQAESIKISIRHFAYLQDVIDNFDYYFDAVKPDVLDGLGVVDYSEPRQHMLMPSGISFYFSSFAEPLDTTDIYLQKGQLKEGDVVFDLGSYCGSTVWGFSKAVGKTGKVYGLEPDPVNFEMLSKNVEYHKLSNVVTVNKGVWSTSGTLLFQGEGNMGSGISQVQGRAANLFSVSVISLTDLCTQYDISAIDYIKMDIEGAEVEVLKASGNLLRKYQPRLIIEPHVVDARLVTDELCEMLASYGYDTEVLVQADLPLPLIYAYPTEKK